RLLSLRNLNVRALTAPVEMVVAMRNVADAKQAGHIFRAPSCYYDESGTGNRHNSRNRREISPLREPTRSREVNAKKRRRLVSVEMTGLGPGAGMTAAGRDLRRYLYDERWFVNRHKT